MGTAPAGFSCVLAILGRLVLYEHIHSDRLICHLFDRCDSAGKGGLGKLLAGSCHPADQAALGVCARTPVTPRPIQVFLAIARRLPRSLPSSGRDYDPRRWHGIWAPTVPRLLCFSRPAYAGLSMVGTRQTIPWLQPLHYANCSIYSRCIPCKYAGRDNR